MATKYLDRAHKLTEAKIKAAMKKSSTPRYPHGNASAAALLLGVPRPTLLHHLRNLKIR